MATFLTRVELHLALAPDYAKLHEAMRAEKFSQVIKGDNGIIYHLPTAEYVSHSINLDPAGVRSLAVQAAAKTGKNASIITVRYDSASWSGLTPVSAAGVG